MNRLLKLFLLTYIFTTFNREFRLFGWDLRYAVVVMAAILLAGKVMRIALEGKDGTDEPGAQNAGGFSFADLAVFYGLAALSNLSWFWNGLTLNVPVFENLVILNVSNALFASVIVAYRGEIDREEILRYSIVSLVVMVASMIWVYFGRELPEALHDNAIRDSNEGEAFVNAFGVHVRVAGFAEDANYATLFSAIGFALCFAYYRAWTIEQIGMASLFAYAFAISFSRSVIIGVLAAVLMLLARVVITKSWRAFSWVASIAIALFGLVSMSRITLLQELGSTRTRFVLWTIAQSVFEANPVLGGGLSSVRSAINAVYWGSWYVQCHSAYWQILAEHGIAALATFVVIVARRYAACEKWWQVLMMTVFIFLCLTSEMMYQQVFVYVLVLMPMLVEMDAQGEPASEADGFGSYRNVTRIGEHAFASGPVSFGRNNA